MTPSGTPASPSRRAPGCLLRRLQYDGVTRGESRGRHAEPEREREVERRDDGEDAVRTEDVGVALVRRKLPEGRLESRGRLDLPAVGLDQIDGLLDLGDRLGPHLPHFVADRRRELEFAVVDQPLRRPQSGNALGVRQPPPFALRCLRRLDGLRSELGAFTGAARDPLAARRILPVERIAGRDLAAANEMRQRLGLALPRLRQRCLERAVELGAARSRRVGQPGRHRRNSISRHGWPIALRRGAADGRGAGRPGRDARSIRAERPLAPCDIQ
jgi:hypothetical protein